MERFRRLVCLATAAGLAGFVPALAQAPANLRVDGVVMNSHVIGATPTFCWESGGGQINWQVQVDDDPQFAPNRQGETAGVWFWDSGSDPKGSVGHDQCVQMRSVTRPGSFSRTPDSRSHFIYWRVRVERPGGEWSDWETSSFRMNRLPSMAGAVTVSEDPHPSSAPGPKAWLSGKGITYVVAPGGSDLDEGSRERPFGTLSHAARQLQAGDTLLVRGGTYRESLELSHRSGHRSGALEAPIVIRAYPGETPVIRGTAVGRGAAIRMGPRAGLSHWVFEGLTIGGAASDTGIELSGATSVTVVDCNLEKSMPRTAVGIRVDGDSESITISGCRFEAAIRSDIEIGSAGRVEIRESSFANFNGRHAIRKRGAGSGSLLLAGNRFETGSRTKAAVVLSQGSSNSQITGNIFDGSRRGGAAHGVMIYRSGEITVENNVFYGIGGSGLRLNEMSQNGTYRNNIFAGCGKGIDFVGGVVEGSATEGAAVDYNIFFANRVDLAMSPVEGSYLRHAPTGNCLGDAACDPLFTRPKAGDFTLQPNSPAIDAGDPASAVPSGGGGRRDAGRFEAGADLPPYDYEPVFVVGDTTPRFTWVFTDRDAITGNGDHQTRFQVQIDTLHSFDSRSGSPLFDSGVIESDEEGFTLPGTLPLEPGSYYIRVRQWDGHGLRPGAWSAHTTRFEVTSAVASREAR